MTLTIPGVHHVTAIATDPGRTLSFYTGLLGLRFVKRTVNFDDPGTYHLYFGNETGEPGTILTFFPQPGVRRGRRGPGQTTAVTLAVPEPSLSFWSKRLDDAGQAVTRIRNRFGADVLAFTDPDGLLLEISPGPLRDAPTPFASGPVPADHAIHGVLGVTLSVRAQTETGSFLTGVLGFRREGTMGDRTRFRVSDAAVGGIVDVLETREGAPGVVAAGTIHHVAWRAPDDEAQNEWRGRIADGGHMVTPILDRRYFRSIYFRVPGGALFEIATDGPGFLTDEARERLGSGLMLPAFLEERRLSIESSLPQLPA